MNRLKFLSYISWKEEYEHDYMGTVKWWFYYFVNVHFNIFVRKTLVQFCHFVYQSCDEPFLWNMWNLSIIKIYSLFYLIFVGVEWSCTVQFEYHSEEVLKGRKFNTESNKMQFFFSNCKTNYFCQHSLISTERKKNDHEIACELQN